MVIFLNYLCGSSQIIPIDEFSIDANGRGIIAVSSAQDLYYILYHKESDELEFKYAIDIKLGTGSLIYFIDRLILDDEENYQVVAHPIAEPIDTDGDGIDDLTELTERGRLSPFNPATPVDWENGVTYIPDTTTQAELSYFRTEEILGAQLNELQTVKFYILDAETDFPRLYFLNGKQHNAHYKFADAVDLEVSGKVFRGQIGFHPDIPSPNGSLGTYRFRFQLTDQIEFKYIRLVQRMLSSHLGFIKNNLCYYPVPATVELVESEILLYEDSRVCLISEDDLYGDVDYLPMNSVEGYGLLKVLEPDELPFATDVIILTESTI